MIERGSQTCRLSWCVLMSCIFEIWSINIIHIEYVRIYDKRTKLCHVFLQKNSRIKQYILRALGQCLQCVPKSTWSNWYSILSTVSNMDLYIYIYIWEGSSLRRCAAKCEFTWRWQSFHDDVWFRRYATRMIVNITNWLNDKWMDAIQYNCMAFY